MSDALTADEMALIELFAEALPFSPFGEASWNEAADSWNALGPDTPTALKLVYLLRIHRDQVLATLGGRKLAGPTQGLINGEMTAINQSLWAFGESSVEERSAT